MKKILLIIPVLIMLVACNSDDTEISTEYVACEYTVDSFEEFKTSQLEHEKEEVENNVPGITSFVYYYEDEDMSNDEILIDVLSSKKNGIVSINGGYSYNDDSVNYYTPVKSLKLKNEGTYCITIESGQGDMQSWGSMPICVEKGKHYVVGNLSHEDMLKLLEDK